MERYLQDENTLCIVTEVCYGGDLEQLLRERGYLTETEAARVMHAALRVLEECHRNGICYGDVKPANFLLKWPFPSISDPQALPDIRVADFGCAQEIGPVSFQRNRPYHCFGLLFAHRSIASYHLPYVLWWTFVVVISLRDKYVLLSAGRGEKVGRNASVRCPGAIHADHWPRERHVEPGHALLPSAVRAASIR